MRSTDCSIPGGLFLVCRPSWHWEAAKPTGPQAQTPGKPSRLFLVLREKQRGKKWSLVLRTLNWCAEDLHFPPWFTLSGLWTLFNLGTQSIIMQKTSRCPVKWVAHDGRQRKSCKLLLKRQHKRLSLVLYTISQSRQNNILRAFFWSPPSVLVCDSFPVINGNKIQVHLVNRLGRDWLFSIPKFTQSFCRFTWNLTAFL